MVYLSTQVVVTATYESLGNPLLNLQFTPGSTPTRIFPCKFASLEAFVRRTAVPFGPLHIGKAICSGPKYLQGAEAFCPG
jgi:hypothetical protein